MKRLPGEETKVERLCRVPSKKNGLQQSSTTGAGGRAGWMDRMKKTKTSCTWWHSVISKAPTKIGEHVNRRGSLVTWCKAMFF